MATYYAILGIPPASQGQAVLSQESLRLAYRRALLRHHPDKANAQSTPAPRPSIDAVSEAFRVLSDPKLRQEYDLAQRAAREAKPATAARYHTGLESIDLDDLVHSESEDLWYRACRCGEDRGYSIHPRDLEAAADDGVLLVACTRCSLWLKVCFALAEDPEEQQQKT